jgi:hypothetical protein
MSETVRKGFWWVVEITALLPQRFDGEQRELRPSQQAGPLQIQVRSGA